MTVISPLEVETDSEVGFSLREGMSLPGFFFPQDFKIVIFSVLGTQEPVFLKSWGFRLNWCLLTFNCGYTGQLDTTTVLSCRPHSTFLHFPEVWRFEELTLKLFLKAPEQSFGVFVFFMGGSNN